MGVGHENDARAPVTPEVEQALVAGHRRFLRYLERRVGNLEIAEEILQAAYVKTFERDDVPVDEGGAVAWFYRLLRNAMIDWTRRQATAERVATQLRMEEKAGEFELRREVCHCMHDILPALKAEYASVLRQVDLEERPLAEVAGEEGITINNATVRLHRARQALRRQLTASCGTCAEHGCLDCSCGKSKV